MQLLQDVRALRASCQVQPDGQLDLECLVDQLHDLGYACYLKHNNPGGCWPHGRWRRCRLCGCPRSLRRPLAVGWALTSGCMPARRPTCFAPAPPREEPRTPDAASVPALPAVRAAADPGHRHNIQPSCLEKLRHEFVVVAGRADGSLSHWCLVDPRFREQFAIAQPTAVYDRLLKVRRLAAPGGGALARLVRTAQPPNGYRGAQSLDAAVLGCCARLMLAHTAAALRDKILPEAFLQTCRKVVIGSNHL